MKLPVAVASWLLTMALCGCLSQVYGESVTEGITGLQVGAAPLASIVVNRRNIFDADAQPAYQLINKLHIITRESVIRRELWMQPGDLVTAADADELERNLRKLDFFASVRVSLRPNDGSSGAVDLIIDTSDRLSIVASAGGSFLGGIGEVSFSIGENNLLGLGHQLVFGYSENSEGELLGSLAYENVLVGSDDIYAGLRVGQTEEGEFAVFSLNNRFINFDDDRFWKVEIERETRRDDFFEAGESIAEVPRTNERANLQWQQRYGHPSRLLRIGPVLELRQTQYGVPIGPEADTIERPNDSTSIFAGGFIALDSNREFLRVNGIDTLRFEQDVTLGFSAQLLAGLEKRTTEIAEDTVPTVFIKGWSTNSVTTNTFFNVALDSFASVDNQTLSRWSVSTASTLFSTRFTDQTLAARVRFESAFDRDGLPPQQTLGEAQGLRGFPAREFNGEQSLLINLEHRWRTPLRFASLEFGTVGFFDAGWVGDRGDSSWLDEAQSGAGFGIRVGSPQLLGSGVVRIDLAFPLGSAADEYDPSLSLAVGQVFGFTP